MIRGWRVKRQRIGILFCIMLFVFVTLFQNTTSVNAASVKLNRKQATMYVGESLQLTLKNATKKITWNTSNKKVATVSRKGKVKAKKSGTAIITAKCGKKKYQCRITVRQTCLNKTSITLKYGEKTSLKLLYPKKKVAWFSSDKRVAFADGNYVTGKSVGTAVITAKCDGKSYLCDVVVTSGEDEDVTEGGIYTSRDKVALYIHTFGKLPSNFITKNEAKALGWTGGSLLDAAPQKCIGGDFFSNYEKKLPEKAGRNYHECDINTLGALSRGAERIVYSDDGLVFYTADHYETFTQLY